MFFKYIFAVYTKIAKYNFKISIPYYIFKIDIAYYIIHIGNVPFKVTSCHHDLNKEYFEKQHIHWEHVTTITIRV